MEHVIESLIQLSSEELAIAKSLYKKGNYHKSLFLFQQSVEKAYKAVGLDSKSIVLTDLRKIGHDYVELLKLTFRGMSSNTRIKIIDGNADILNVEPPNNEEEIYSAIMQSARADFFNLKEEEIQELLNILSTYKKNISSADAMLNNLLFIKDVAVSSGKLNNEQLMELQSLKISDMDKKDQKKLIQYQTYSLNLQMLGLMTSPHSEQTRYPLSTNNYQCPTKIYTIDFPLIKHQPQLMKIAGEAIKFMGKTIPSA